jgi:antitoxin component of MazEF toxin-antitoxin module
MIQKLLNVGSSKAVTVPKNALKELGLEKAHSVSVTVDTENRRFIVEPLGDVDGELVSWTKGFIEKYRPALEALSKK